MGRHTRDAEHSLRRDRNGSADFAIVVALLTTIAIGACYFPARRASRTDPIAVLREE